MTEKAVDDAIARGLVMAAEIEGLRTALEGALRGLCGIGGVNGMEAAAFGIMQRIRNERKTPPG